MENEIGSLRFLIVEDHEFQRQLLERALAGFGAASVHSAANGVQAMRVLRDPASQIDIVISDVMMPEVDGIELIAMLRQAAANVALVLSSADTASLNAAEAIARGQGLNVLGAIGKPITPDKLRPLLDHYLAQRQRPVAPDR